MELKPIVDALTTLLTPALPFLVKGGESAAAEVGKRLTGATWDKATAVWGKLRNKVEADPITAGTVEAIAEGDVDPDAEAILRRRLKRLLNQDPQLVQELAQLLERPPRGHAEATVEGDGAVAQQGGIAVGAQGEAKVAQRDLYDLRQEIHNYAPQSEEGLSPETLRNHYLSRTLW